MFRHIVMFRWSDEATADAKAAAIEGLAQLPSQIPEVRAFQFGQNAGADDNYDLGVVADFDDIDSYRRYAEHPAHVALVTDRLRPIIAARAAVQHHVDG